MKKKFSLSYNLKITVASFLHNNGLTWTVVGSKNNQRSSRWARDPTYSIVNFDCLKRKIVINFSCPAWIIMDCIYLLKKQIIIITHHSSYSNFITPHQVLLPETSGAYQSFFFSGIRQTSPRLSSFNYKYIKIICFLFLIFPYQNNLKDINLFFFNNTIINTIFGRFTWI